MAIPVHRAARARRAGVGLAAATLLALAPAPAALADGMAGMPDMPGMSAAEHARMSHDATGARHGHEHGSMPGMDMGGHDEPAATAQRPVALVLGGFALVNGLVVLSAAVLRRRPAAVRRRRTLARVRAAAPRQTVFPAPTEPRS